LEGFDPEQSYGSLLVAVPDPDRLYEKAAVAADLAQTTELVNGLTT